MLALDPTCLGNRLVVLAVSVVVRGGAVPVAWTVLDADQCGSWNDHWAELLGRLREALGEGWQVFVLSDRGVESAELFRAVLAMGWHPLMRVKAAGTFRPDGWVKRWPMHRFAAAVGRHLRAARGGLQAGVGVARDAAGLLGGRPRGAVAAADRPGCGVGEPGVVRLPQLDRSRSEAGEDHLAAGRAAVSITAGGDEGVARRVSIFYNLVRRVMHQAAKQQHVAPERISFVDAWRWLRHARPGQEVPPLTVNPERPGRVEPRCASVGPSNSR